MKKICTFFAAVLLCTFANAQLVLNELYTDPGNGKNEFFELYNTSIAPESANNYTLVTYYNSYTLGAGFYVLDLPNITVAGKGILVGSSATPFTYQGVTNSTNSNFNWNNSTWLTENEGSLVSWKKATANLADGNTEYDKTTLSGSFNDFFNRLSGNGSSYVVLLFKNGILVNSAIFGAGGQSAIPSEVVAMPALAVTMAGTAPNFNINFSTYTNLPIEAVGADAGSDNGFIREFDGACGSWKKSTSSATHTPQISNGTQSTSATGNIATVATVKKGTAATGTSVVTYKVTAAPSSDLPASLYVYIDNGSVDGQLDVNDALLATTVVSTIGQIYQQSFSPFNEDVLVVTKNSAGCIDNLKMGEVPAASTLPVHLLSFSGSVEGAKARLNWSVGDNETGSHFEIQSSSNGKDFKAAAIVFTTEKIGIETYNYKDAKDLTASAYFRLKMVNKDGSMAYSKTVYLKVGSTEASAITLLQNPVQSTLAFNYTSHNTGTGIVTVYSNTGAKLQSSSVVITKGVNAIVEPLNSTLRPGLYLLEMVTETERTTAKFMKQ